MRREFVLLLVIVVATIFMIAGVWFKGCYDDAEREQKLERQMEIAVQIKLIETGAAIGQGQLIAQIRRAQKLEPDSAATAALQTLLYFVDSLRWERDRIFLDTLTMPEKP